jgi:hypothetical protein
MTVRVLSSSAGSRNPQVVERPRRAGEDNAGWLRGVLDGRLVEASAEWSLLLLVGGDDPLSFRLRVAQSHVRHDLSPSSWSHVAFVPRIAEPMADSRLIEVSLAPPGRFGNYGFPVPSNGLQEARLAPYLDADLFPNVALLSAPVAAASVAERLEALKLQRSILDIPQLILRWLAYAWGVGVPASPLADGIGIPAAAVLEAACAALGFDLTPGLESRSSCPEAIWQAATWWHGFYERTAGGKVIRGAYWAPHELVPDARYGGSPAAVRVAPAPPRRPPRKRAR